MYTFFTHSRSAWRKSVENAARLVAAGKMAEEEFALAPASPHPRDPAPAALLETARRCHAAEQAWKAGAADRAAKEAAARRATEAKIDELRHVRCWRFAGFYMEDLSLARYTLAEIEAWVRWASPCFHAKHPTVFAQTEDNLCVDFSPCFEEVCGNRVPFESNHDKLCRDLAAYTEERRKLAARGN